jgi:hypothetical protein
MSLGLFIRLVYFIPQSHQIYHPTQPDLREVYRNFVLTDMH